MTDFFLLKSHNWLTWVRIDSSLSDLRNKSDYNSTFWLKFKRLFDDVNLFYKIIKYKLNSLKKKELNSLQNNETLFRIRFVVFLPILNNAKKF